MLSSKIFDTCRASTEYIIPGILYGIHKQTLLAPWNIIAAEILQEIFVLLSI
jgi:hypothetical protein